MAVHYKAISFAGCGFLGIYHLGAAQAFVARGGAVLNSLEKFAGASSGSLIAAVLAVCPEKLKECTSRFYGLAEAVRRRRLGGFTPGFDLLHLLRVELAATLPEDAHRRATGRLFVSLTHAATMRNVIVSQFASVDELIQAVLCSCSIPGYSASPWRLPRYTDGQCYIDGGMTNNLPTFGDAVCTILVSPFCGGQHVSPHDRRTDRGACNSGGGARTSGRRRRRRMYINFAGMDAQLSVPNLARAVDGFAPPPIHELQHYERAGYLHALRFLRSCGCGSCAVAVQRPHSPLPNADTHTRQGEGAATVMAVNDDGGGQTKP